MLTLWYRPLAGRQTNLFEVYNDYTLLLLTYLLWCFTDIVGEAETRHALGFVFIAVSLTNVAVHVIFMASGSFSTLKDKCKKRCCKQRKTKV